MRVEIHPTDGRFEQIVRVRLDALFAKSGQESVQEPSHRVAVHGAICPTGERNLAETRSPVLLQELIEHAL